MRRSIAARIGRPELTALVLIAVAAILLAGFLILASEVTEGETLAFDKAILLSLRNPADHAQPIGPAWLVGAMRDITSLGSVTVLSLLTLAAAGFALVAGRPALALLMVAAVAGGSALSTILKVVFARPRPDFVAHGVEVFTQSFPSGHAMLSAVAYLTLGVLVARIVPDRRSKAYVLALCTVLTLAVGASRVYLGVHYPTDVLAGWALGALWAMLCLVVAWFIAERRADAK
jgi:undecaprenyl-diphosphatase